MLVTVSPELRSFVEDHGGSVYVRCRPNRCCRGVTFLDASVEPPAILDDYLMFLVDGVLVHARLPRALRPHELQLTLEGRRRPRPVASWDGCAFIA